MVEIRGYRILQKLGEGGMGAVYKAVDERTGKVVAVKVLDRKLAQDEEYVRRFHREARAAAALNHRNLTQVIAEGEVDGLHFLVMEFIDGKTVADMVAEEGPFPPEVALAVVRQAAEGLAYAHARAVIHRDIKPENIMLSSDGTVKITDMGLAKRLGSTSKESQITLAGTILGTPRYMAPEQIRTPEKTDHRADIWALGVTLYFLLTGKTPFDGGSPLDTIHNVLKNPVRYPPRMPAPLQNLLRRMLTKDPQRRFQSCEEVIAAIDETVRLLHQQRRTPTHIPTPPAVHKKRFPLYIPLTAAAFVLILLIALLIPKHTPPSPVPQKPPSSTQTQTKSQDSLKQLKAWIQQHPDDFPEIYRRIRRLQQKEPALAPELEKEIATLRRRAEQAVENALNAARVAIENGDSGFATRLAHLRALRAKVTIFPDIIAKLNEGIKQVDKLFAAKAGALARTTAFVDFSKPVVLCSNRYVVKGAHHKKGASGWALYFEQKGTIALEVGKLVADFIGLRVEGNGKLRIKDKQLIAGEVLRLEEIDGKVSLEAGSGAVVKRIDVVCYPLKERPVTLPPRENDFADALGEMGRLLAKAEFEKAIRLGEDVEKALPQSALKERWSTFLARLRDSITALPHLLRRIVEANPNSILLRSGERVKGKASIHDHTIRIGGQTLRLVDIHPSLLEPFSDNMLAGVMVGAGRWRKEGFFVAHLLDAVRQNLPAAGFGERIGRYAVIITGRSFNALQALYYLSDNIRFARLFRDVYGYPPEAIWRLCEGGRGATLCATAAATKENIRRVFKYLGKVAGKNDPVFVVVVGASDGHRLALEDGPTDAEEFARLVSPLKSQRVAFVMQFGGSGGFAKLLSRRGWVALASSREGEPSAAGWIGAVRNALEKGATLYEAYEAGCRATEKHYRNKNKPQAEHPVVTNAALARRWRIRKFSVAESAVAREAQERAKMLPENWLPSDENSLWGGLCGFVRERCGVRDFTEALARAGARISKAHLVKLPLLLYYGRYGEKSLSEHLAEVKRMTGAVMERALKERDGALAGSAVWVQLIAERISGKVSGVSRRVVGAGLPLGWKGLVCKAALALADGRRGTATDLASAAAAKVVPNYKPVSLPRGEIKRLRRALMSRLGGDSRVLGRVGAALLAADVLSGEGWAALALARKGEGASEMAAAALLLAPDSGMGYLAMAHSVRGEPEAALLWLAEAERRGVGAAAGFIKRLRKELKNALQKRRDGVTAALRRAKTLLEKEPITAAAAIRQHLTLGRMETFSVFGEALQRAGFVERAVRVHCALALLTAAENAAADPLFMAATLLLVRGGNAKAALALFRLGERLFAERNGHSARVWWLMMARCYRRLGDEDAARDCEKRAANLRY